MSSIQTPATSISERSREEIIDRARSGDELAFQQLLEPHLRELHVHCYRMLGSLTDADDLVQETITAAWKGLGEFAGRSSLRTWLYHIATNRCLNAIRDAKRRPPPEPIPPFSPPPPSHREDVTWVQPYPDALLPHESSPEHRALSRERIELAFIVALQRLPPRQTAALVLCDVLGFSMGDAGPMLDCGPTAIKGLLQRARRTMGEREHSMNGAETADLAADDDLAGRFADAFVSDNLDTLVTLLTDDAWLAMPPAPHVYDGWAAIRDFLRTSSAWRGERHLRLIPTRANGQPAFALYLSENPDSELRANGAIVLSIRAGRIKGITRFLDARLPSRFGLPVSLPVRADRDCPPGGLP